MRFRLLPRFISLILLVLAAAILPARAVAGASSQPTRLLAVDSSASRYFEVRPAQVDVAGDGTHIFGGPRRPGDRFGRIRWQSWGNASAYGKAIDWVDNCKPDCASGKWKSYGYVRLHASRPVDHRFARLRAHSTRVLNSFKLKRGSGSFWYWLESPR